MAQDKAVKNSTADKGIKVSKGNLRALKGRLKASGRKETRGRKEIPVDYDKLTMYSSQAMSNKDIATILGISEATFYVRMAQDQEFKQAYEAGINNRKYNLEKALLKRAEGYDTQEKETISDGEGNVIKVKTTEKSYVPDTTALIFSLKNLYSDKYKEVVQTQTDININVNQIHQLTDDELAKIASAPILEAIEYSIE
jgi:transposase